MSKKKLSKGVKIVDKNGVIKLFVAGEVSVFSDTGTIPPKLLEKAERGIKVGKYTLVANLKEKNKTTKMSACTCWGEDCPCYWECSGECYCDTIG